MRDLTQAHALANPHDEATRIRDDIGFFQAVRGALAKRTPGEARPEEELNLAVRQIISRAVSSEGMLDIFEAAGLDRPDISVLSDDFLAEVQGMPHRNLAVELLQKLLKAELSVSSAQERGAGAEPSPRCWSRRCAAIRTVPCKRRRSSRS